MNFIIYNQENFQTNSSIHNTNTRNKLHLHRSNASLSCFQKVHSMLAQKFSTVYHLVWQSSRMTDKIESSLKKIPTYTILSLCRWFIILCIILQCNLYFCVFMIFSTSYCLYDTLIDPRNIYVCVCFYVCIYVCMYVYMYT